MHNLYSCHLALGEIEDALKRFKKCLQSDDGARSDQKILVEASEGVQKAQVADQSTAGFIFFH